MTTTDAAATRMRPYDDDDARWAAITARDPQADGHFVYGVRTTGVYCRPSSAARLPRRENVEFFATEAAARAAGYRPSRHAGGDQTSVASRRAASVERACRLIERTDALPSLEALAEATGVSAFHLHRIFKAETGLTPRAYAAAHRARRLRDALGAGAPTDTSDAVARPGPGNIGTGGNGREGKGRMGGAAADVRITDAIYDAGFNSAGRFYAASRDLLGMRPKDYRAGGPDLSIRFAVGQCSLGAILVARSQRGLCAILLGDDPGALVRDLEDRFPKATLIAGDAAFERLVAEVVGFVEAPHLGLRLPLDVRGTAFQQRVWQALSEIPPGATASYSQVAARIGQPAAVRAVAQACGANALAVAIPCHRVVRRDGDLSGYRFGIDRKRALLLREAASTATGPVDGE